MIQPLSSLLETQARKFEVDEYLEELRNDHLGLVGGSPAMVALRDLIRRVAQSARPVLISGPSGSGKSLVADAIHRLSGWGAAGGEVGQLIRLSCQEASERDLENVLFGSEAHAGVFAAGPGTTLTLEDVNALPPGLQAKIARLLQTGMFRGPGAPQGRRLAVRVLAATSRSLARCVRENIFRADLLYELGVLTVPVPGLDEHRDDIPALVNHFLRLGSSNIRFSGDALELLTARSWPGSVRELRNLVERAMLQSRDHVVAREATRALIAPEPIETTIEDSLHSLAGRLLQLPLGNKLAAVEVALLESAMRQSGGNKSGAARLLGLHRKAVERKLEKYGVRAGLIPEYRSPEARAQVGVEAPAGQGATRAHGEPCNRGATKPGGMDRRPDGYEIAGTCTEYGRDQTLVPKPASAPAASSVPAPVPSPAPAAVSAAARADDRGPSGPGRLGSVSV